ncbi:DUF11 domain-containing protein [Candidatus Saccharibacteria bacterium]|nr:DUF11 domain-containing protein [Candidatus Saccharibacteria bacterium]
MSKLMSLIRRSPKRVFALVAVAAAALIVPVAALAWGPDRPTFTMENPAPYVTFNSITNNGKVGDERNFLRIRESGTGEYINQVNFEPGKVYDVSVYYHNNAATRLNASGEGIAKDATLKIEMPYVIKAGVNAALTSTISASNAKPTSVWDEAYGKNNTNAEIALRYVAGSAKFVSNGAINGQTLPDSLFTTGAKLGFDSQNGTVPGCNEYSGFVNFKIRIDQPNYEVKKVVSTDDGKTWVDSVKAQPGSTVTYGISYQNTGTNQQDDVVVRDMLPAGVAYVPDSTYLMNSVTKGKFEKASDGITTVGYNAGSYQSKGNVFFKFNAKLPSKDQLKCGTNTLVNTARVSVNGGYKEDTATVTIDNECKPVVKYTCDALGVTVVDRTHFTFNTKYTVQNATFKSVTYVIKNANGKVVDTKTSNGTSLNYTQTTVGKYTVQATVTVTVDGTTKTVTSDACKASFEVPAQPGNITVCELSTKKIVTIKENQFDAAKYSKDLSKCAETPVPPVTPPTTPPELPHTGMTENIVAITGLGALIASIAYYVASRRALNQ